MTAQELVTWCVDYAAAHPILAVLYFVIGFTILRQLVMAMMNVPGAIEDAKEKRLQKDAASKYEPKDSPTDTAKKDGPWTR